MTTTEPRRPVLFVTLTFVISWGSLGILFPVGPALAAGALAWRQDRARGLRELVSTLRAWRFDRRLYGVILGGPFVGGGIVYVLWRLLGYGTTSISWLLLLLSPVLTVVFALVACFEEVGWRGYLLPALEERMSPRLAAVVVGVVWGAWHVPLLFAGGALNDRLPVFAYPAITIPGSFIYAWLYHRSEESLFAVTLLHGAQQGLILPLIWNIYRNDASITAFFCIAIALVWVVGMALAWRQPALGPRVSRFRASDRASAFARLIRDDGH